MVLYSYTICYAHLSLYLAIEIVPISSMQATMVNSTEEYVTYCDPISSAFTFLDPSIQNHQFLDSL